MKLQAIGMLGLALALAAPAAHGEVGFHGQVLDSRDRPVAGAVVSARHRELARQTSVYTDSEGRFAMPALSDGIYDVRARHFGYEDRFEMGASPGSDAITLRLARVTDHYDKMAALPSNRWFALALAAMPDEEMREEFDRQCTFCHQQGSWATRVQRTPEEWDKIFSLMARMGGIVSSRTREALPEVLNAAYDHEQALPKLEEQLEKYPLPNPAGLGAVIDEWDVGDRASVQHDIVVHPSGHVYSVDTTKDVLYRLDPETGERKSFAIPSDGLPLGGVFAGSSNVLPPNADARVAPHSLQVASDGKIWVTLCLGNKIGIFDPATESWKLIDQWDGLYPHTLRFDDRGRVWYTLAVSNHVAMIDPNTGERATIRLPGRTWKQGLAARITPMIVWLGSWGLPAPETVEPDTMLPVPYGIDIAPDGGVWFSQLNIGRIGRIDPETRRYELFDTPFPGPRRLRFDSKGNLWVPGFSAGVVARFDTKKREWKTWDLPIHPKGTETPYALNVDRKTDTVWICGTNSDTLIKFEPGTERWTVFPLPTRVTYTREIDFDEHGGVWTSNSNTPGWHIETPNPQVIRLREDARPPTATVAAR